MLEQLYQAAMRRKPVPLDDAQALRQAHPEGTLSGDLLAGVTIDAGTFLVRCELSPASVVLGVSSVQPWTPEGAVAADLLRANTSLAEGAASMWSFDARGGGLMLTSSVDPGALLSEESAFETWLLAVSQCFVKSWGIVHSEPDSIGSSGRVAELVAAALPVAECRVRLAEACSGELGWDAELPRMPAWMAGLEGRWPGAQRVGGRLRWLWGSWTLEAMPHRWARIDEIELRLLNEDPDALDPERIAGALEGDGQLPYGASVVGALIDDGRLVRIWRFPDFDEPLKTADALIEALQVYRS